MPVNDTWAGNEDVLRSICDDHNVKCTAQSTVYQNVGTVNFLRLFFPQCKEKQCISSR